jgi:hypothetical protein
MFSLGSRLGMAKPDTSDTSDTWLSLKYIENNCTYTDIKKSDVSGDSGVCACGTGTFANTSMVETPVH